jgi:hypothetical protein
LWRRPRPRLGCGAKERKKKKKKKKLTTHLHLAPKLRMRGAISPLPQYVFMAWCR